MRFACEQCQTKYSIPDDRVRGKILKIRCKNCGCLISVSEGGVRTARSAEPSGIAAMSGLADGPGEGGDSTMIGGMADFFGKGFPPPDTAEDWHLSIDGNQNGPMPLSDLTQRIAEQAGSSAELYIWRDGFDGWKAVDAVPEVQAAVEKARGATAKPSPVVEAKGAAAPVAKAPFGAAAKAALPALEADNGGDATQIGSLNLPLDLGKTDDKVDDDVQDLSMMSLDADAFEALIEKPAKSAVPPKAPPPFKSPPPRKPAAPPPKPAGPPPKPAGPPPKPASGGMPPAAKAGPLFKTLPHPGLRPAEPEPAPSASAPASTPAPVIAPLLTAPQAESVPNLASLMPSAPASAQDSAPLSPPSSPPSSPPPSNPPASFPPPEPAGLSANPFEGLNGGGLDAGTSSADSPPGSRSMLPKVLIIGVVLALVGGGGYFFLTRPGNPLGPKIEKPDAAVDAGTTADAGPPDAGTKAGGNKPDEKKSELEGLDEATFKDLLESGEKALKKCYTKALKKDSALGGTKLKVEVEVTGKGKASEVIVEGDGEKLGKCLEKAVKKWKFKKGEDKKPYKVRFPLTVDKG
jgi:predicted Zn finger-like uncharacterized protein